MKMIRQLVSLLALLSLALVASPAWADEYQDTINVFKKAIDSSVFFKTAYGYAVFPTIGKGGIGVGGAYGEGRVYEKGKYIGNTSMTQVTVGFQLGGQAYSEIVFLEDFDLHEVVRRERVVLRRRGFLSARGNRAEEKNGEVETRTAAGQRGRAQQRTP